MLLAKKFQLKFDEAWTETDILDALAARKVGDSWIVEADVSDLLSVLKPIRAYGDLDIEVEIDKDGDFAIHLPPHEKPPGKPCPRCHGTGFV